MVTENKKRIETLKEYVMELHNGGNEEELYKNYQDEIESVTAQETFTVFNDLLDEKLKAEDVLVFIEKAMDAFEKSLSKYDYDNISNYKFLADLAEENEALLKKIVELEKRIESENVKEILTELVKRTEELSEFIAHYAKKENILFPYMEKNDDKFVGVSIMWALHDLVRNRLKKIISMKDDDKIDEGKIKHRVASLFKSMRGLTNQEKLILFPSAIETLRKEEWDEMYKQSFEYGFPFINKKDDNVHINTKKDYGDFKLQTETGEVSFNQIVMILDNLPVDITFVDENNRVRYFSRPKDRFFPRSPAIIGRDVKNCHPPDSVHLVERIVESFRSGKKNEAKFWINLRGKTILIQYFALRDGDNSFKGVLEVSQDITGIKELEGERRLLDWED